MSVAKSKRIEGYYGVVQKSVMELPISAHAKALYAYLIATAGPAESCSRSYGDMTRSLRLSKPTLSKCITELEAASLLAVDRVSGQENTYSPLRLANEPAVQSKSVVAKFAATPDGLRVYIGFDDSVDQTGKKYKGFWSLYGKPVDSDRRNSEQLFGKLSESDRALVMQRVAIYVKVYPDPTYRKNPSRYLRYRSFEDKSLHNLVSNGSDTDPESPQRLSGSW